MARLSVPYLKLRDGRPRWEPGPRLRARGYKGRDLKDEAGQWLPLDAAIAAARELNRACEPGAPLRRPKAPRDGARTCRQLFDLWWGTDTTKPSADFGMLATSTRRDYRNKGELFLTTPVDDAGELTFADAPVRAISKPTAFGFWEQAYANRGLHMANGIKAVASAAFSYAELKGWRDPGSNPWKQMGRPAAQPRLAIWLPTQVNAFLEVADASPDTRSIGDAIVLGLHSAQRLADVLDMPSRIFTADRICLTQHKRRALIDIKMTTQVRRRVTDIRERWRAVGVVAHATLLINELTGEPYNPNIFNKRFRAVRAAAAERFPPVALEGRWTGARLYQLAELRFQDLRDTAVTRLWQVPGMTAAHIAAVTGHSLATIHQIMKHYLALNRAMGDEAIDRLEAWLEAEGIAV